jgi:hypothetical protein
MLGRVRSEFGNLRLEAAHDDLRGHLARDLAGTVSAHAVRQHRDPDGGVRRNAVLVELTHAAGVGNCGYFDKIMRHATERLVALFDTDIRIPTSLRRMDGSNTC